MEKHLRGKAFLRGNRDCHSLGTEGCGKFKFGEVSVQICQNCLRENQSNQIFHYTRCITPKRVTTFRAHPRIIAPGQHNFIRRNIAAVASRWQHCVRFDRPEI